jgi:hypothetical protein
MIASFHRSRLESELGSPDLTGAAIPPIPVQAHFEGVIVALMAVVDQVAQAANKALELRLPPHKLVEDAFGKLGDAMPDVRSWFGEEIGRDLRRIRVRIIHYHYTKNPAEHRWKVESADTGYSGSRELLAYASAGIEYVQRLGTMPHSIETELAKSEATE